VSTTEPEPVGDDPGDLEGKLSTVTDQEWRAAHERLITDIEDADPPDGHSRRLEQFDYEWSPGE
jgi:hypothetical protein